MRGRKPVPVEVSTEMRDALVSLLKRHLTPQQYVVRAMIVLLASEGKNNTQISQELHTTVDTVRLWRERWNSFAGIPLSELSMEERLEDAPRPGTPPRISAEQVCQIVALACEAPEQSGRPISHWTGREVADEIMRRGIVETISPRHAQRLLKRGISNPTASATG